MLCVSVHLPMGARLVCTFPVTGTNAVQLYTQVVSSPRFYLLDIL